MKFSIVIATYNRKALLDRCIQSVVNQTYDNFELLIIDDGSTDGTAELMQTYTDSRIQYHCLDKNYGNATVARNVGIEKMTGDALIIWDSDDEFLPHALITAANAFCDDDEVGMVTVGTDFIQNGQIMKKDSTGSRKITASEWFGSVNPYHAVIMAIKKEYIDDVRFQSKGIDFMFYAEIIARHMVPVQYVAETCGKIYIESDELSLTTERKKRNPILSMERAPILDDFLTRHGHLYLAVHNEERYAGYAFGAAVGYILLSNYNKARMLLRTALKHNFKIIWLGMYVAVSVPGLRAIVRKLLNRQT